MLNERPTSAPSIGAWALTIILPCPLLDATCGPPSRLAGLRISKFRTPGAVKIAAFVGEARALARWQRTRRSRTETGIGAGRTSATVVAESASAPAIFPDGLGLPALRSAR